MPYRCTTAPPPHTYTASKTDLTRHGNRRSHFARAVHSHHPRRRRNDPFCCMTILQRTCCSALSIGGNPQVAPSPGDFVALPEKDRATAIGNVHKKLVKIVRVFSEICSRTDRQTDRQTCSSHYDATALAGEVITYKLQPTRVAVYNLTSLPSAINEKTEGKTFRSVYGNHGATEEDPELGVRCTNANCPRIFKKNPLSKSQKHAISSEKNHVGREGTYSPSQTAPRSWTPLFDPAKPSGSDSASAGNSSEVYDYVETDVR